MRPTSNTCRLALLPGLVFMLLLGACASGGKSLFAASARKAPVIVAVPVSAAAPSGTVGASGTKGPAGAEPALSAIYFDPDTYTVKDSYRPVLQTYAKRLIAEPDLHLRIDGHTDDNGPGDYNLELARMRAQMVMKQLVSMGVPAEQLQIVGHGKEKPKARGGRASADAVNRRVELSYR